MCLSLIFEYARRNEVVYNAFDLYRCLLQVCGKAFSSVIGRDVYNRDQGRSQTRFVGFVRLAAIERGRYSGRGFGCVLRGQALDNVDWVFKCLTFFRRTGNRLETFVWLAVILIT